MSFIPPTWDSANAQYVINLLPATNEGTRVSIKKDSNGSTTFENLDNVENVTDSIIHDLIDVGSKGNLFTKLPSHDQLMKRVRHTFKSLATDTDNAAVIGTLLLTPKQITLVWTPVAFVFPSAPQISFDDSDESGESDEGEEVDVPESDLPPVELVDDSKQTQEEYLLTRLRAAKARVEAEQIRMQYFEAIGRMPPDSDSEDE
jgi:hypothetical protein